MTKQKRKGVSVMFHKEQVDFLDDLFFACSCPMLKKMRKPAILAAMIETHLKGGQEAASEFWKKVRDGNDLGHKDPRLKLRDYLATTAKRNDRNICIKAWNLYRQERTIEGELCCKPDEGTLLPV